MKTEPTEALANQAIQKITDSSIFEINYEEDNYDAGYSAALHNHGEDLYMMGFLEGQSSPKIKQLEWEDTDMWYFKSKTSLGLGYSITEIKGTYIVHFGDAPISWEKSLESAKVAAQADFEKRIKECLE